MLFPFHFVENPTIWSWYLEPTVTVGILLTGFLYFRWIKQYREKNPGEEGATRKQQVYFGLGLLTFVFALLSPIDPWAEYLLSVHMLQHILLTIVGPPLLVYGLPKPMVNSLSGIGRPWTAWRFITKPLIAFALFNFTFSAIHLPAVYNLILTNQAFHIAMHLALMGTAIVAWWPVLAPGAEHGELTSLKKMVYLVAHTVPGQIVGAIITLTGAPIYAEYANAPYRLWGMSLQTDQEVGGLLMWVGVGSFYLAAAGRAFFIWARDADAAERRRITGGARTVEP